MMQDYLKIALPKGRRGKDVLKRLDKAGMGVDGIWEDNRRLIFIDDEKKLVYFWAKPSDVPIYVERGAADLGVAGKDIILEYNPNVYELMDLDLGICRLAVAARSDFQDDTERPLRVATKFPHVAAAFYAEKNRETDIIKLNGSIELAPLLGLSDVIVDIVETGKTLQENDLKVIETVAPVSARLIANKAAYPFITDRIQAVLQALGNAGDKEE